MSRQEILHSYRHLLRHSLRAIHFSKPARYDVIYTLRSAFRSPSSPPPTSSPSSHTLSFPKTRIENTVAFLKSAEESNGIEHKILKNILKVKYWRRRLGGGGSAGGGSIGGRGTMVSGRQTVVASHLRRTMYQHFDETVIALNESLGICLR